MAAVARCKVSWPLFLWESFGVMGKVRNFAGDHQTQKGVMKKVVFMLAAVAMMASCQKSDEQRARELVTDYIMESADDPSSVQDIEVSDFIRMHGDTCKIVTVSFRGRNGYGAIVKSGSMVVKFDSQVTRIVCFDCYGQ